MSKVKVVTKLNGKIENYIGIKNKNRIVYMDNDLKVILTLQDKTLKITRENSDYLLEISPNKCIYTLKNYGKIVYDIKTMVLKINQNSIKFKYKLNDELFDLEVNFEVIE